MDIYKYLTENKFNESLVIKFIYCTNCQIVNIECDYAHDVVQALLQGKRKPIKVEKNLYDRDLRRLKFTGVTNYTRMEGSDSRIVEYHNHYLAKNHKKAVVIQGLTIIQINATNFQININLGDFGQCKFQFQFLETIQKLVKGSPRRNADSGWQYIDINSQKPVDFYNPFDQDI